MLHLKSETAIHKKVMKKKLYCAQGKMVFHFIVVDHYIATACPSIESAT